MLTDCQRAEMGVKIMKIVARKEITRHSDDANISTPLFVKKSVSLEHRALSSDEILMMNCFFLTGFQVKHLAHCMGD